MKRNYHKLMILIFSMMTVWMVAFPTEAAAYSPRISISNNTIMYVSGEGDAESSIIWSSLDRTTIKEIVVESGITGLGDRIFRGLDDEMLDLAVTADSFTSIVCILSAVYLTTEEDLPDRNYLRTLHARGSAPTVLLWLWIHSDEN